MAVQSVVALSQTALTLIVATIGAVTSAASLALGVVGQRRNERERWRREKRSEVYAEYLTLLTDIMHTGYRSARLIHDKDWDELGAQWDTYEDQRKRLNAAGPSLRLVASDEVLDAARRTMTAAEQARNTLYLHMGLRSYIEDEMIHITNLVNNGQETAELMRRDLAR